MKKKIISIPPNYFYICIIINIFFYCFVAQMNLIIFPYNFIGILLCLIGFYFIGKSYFLFKNHRTPEKFKKSTCVIKTGLYKYSRNPMYLGGVIFLLGLSIFLGNIISLLSPIIFFSVINLMFIPYEEEKMELELGDDYLEYKNRVRRWL